MSYFYYYVLKAQYFHNAQFKFCSCMHTTC